VVDEPAKILSYASRPAAADAVDRSAYPWQLRLDAPPIVLRLTFLAVLFLICTTYLGALSAVIVLQLNDGGSVHIVWEAVAVLLLVIAWRYLAIASFNLLVHREACITVAVGSGELLIHHPAKFHPPIRRWPFHSITSIRVRRSPFHRFNHRFTLELVTDDAAVWDIDFLDGRANAGETIEDCLLAALNAMERDRLDADKAQ
jgi:hypothetical protein